MDYARAVIETCQSSTTVLPEEAVHAHYVIYALLSRVRKELKTRPGSLTVENGDKVTWINLFEDPIQVVFFTGNLVFEGFPDAHSNYSFTLAPGGHRTFVVKNTTRPREYSYQVYCPSRELFAEANSDPRIIVL
jgi:hypothetical protein